MPTKYVWVHRTWANRVYQKNNSNNWMIWFYKISPVLEQIPHSKGNLIANLAKLV